VHDEFVGKLVENVRGLRQGRSTGPGTIEVGAVTFPPQLDIIEEHVRDAREKGAKVEVGGERGTGPGRYYRPTVLTNVDHSMLCMQKETFGPTLPVMRVKDAEEAVRLANDSPYGLQASVWTKDAEKGDAIARRIEAGAVCINDALTNYGAFAAPMSGWKESGVGSRHGSQGIRKYCRTQTILTAKLAPKKDMFMFPYKPWRSKALAGMVKFIYKR
jgi:acyl-CoA reductase-like NAD-dependent aldehyde dehydrogenase